MKKTIVLVSVGVLLTALGVFVGWMFGYDFDHRNTDTGSFTIIWLFLSAVIVRITVDNMD